MQDGPIQAMGREEELKGPKYATGKGRHRVFPIGVTGKTGLDRIFRLVRK